MTAIRRFLTIVLLLASSATAAWFAWSAWESGGRVQSTDDAYVHGEITVLSPRVAGYVVAVEADDNDAVAAKQTLVRIDPRDYRSAADRASAAIDQAKAALDQSKSKLTLQASMIEVAEAALKAASAQAENADTTLQRARSLLSHGSGTQAAFDQASATAVSAHALVDQTKAQLNLQRTQIEVLRADVRVAETKVQDAEAAMTTARHALEDTEIWAPIAGVIANRRTRVGEYVTLGTRMLSIVPSEGLWIEANFRETQLVRMKPDQPAAIEVDAAGDRRVCGYVDAIGPASGSEFALIPPDNATGNFTKIVRRFPVRLRAFRSDPNRGLLKPGMSTRVRVAVEGAEIDGCRFDAEKDRQLRSLTKLPPHPGISDDAGASVKTPARP
jgi:membrane fusion protein (multidrug efflux system)